MKYPKSEKYDTPELMAKIMGPNPIKLEEELMNDHKIENGAVVCDLGSGQGLTSVCFQSRFFNLFEWSLLLFCESGSELCFKPHNGYKRSAFICAFLLYSALFFQRMSALMQS